MTEYLSEGKLIYRRENNLIINSPSLLCEAWRNGTVLEARASLCDAQHNLIVDLGAMKGIIPREEGAIGIREGAVRDIAVISRVNRPVCFVVTEIKTDPNGNEYEVLQRPSDILICCLKGPGGKCSDSKYLYKPCNAPDED